MRLKNYTDYPDDEIREIIRFCRPPGIGNFDVRVSNSTTSMFTGAAYPEGSGYHDSANPFVVVRITPDEGKFPYLSMPTKKGGGYLRYLVLTRTEALIHMLAHELRHLWQEKHPGKRGRVWGSRGRSSDRDCDAYAIRKTREWRRMHSPSLTAHDGKALFHILEQGKPDERQLLQQLEKEEQKKSNNRKAELEIIDAKLALEIAHKKRLETKVKRLLTAIKKRQCKIKRLEKKKETISGE
jgi:hypothetical protein